MEKLFAQIEKYIIYAIILLLPVFTLSISPNPYVVSKIALLFYGLILVLLVRAVRVITSGKLEFSVAKYDLPVTIIGISYVLATLLKTPNKMEALLLPGITTVTVGAILIYYLLNQLKDDEKSMVARLLVLSGSVFSVLTLLSFAKIFEKIPQLPGFFKAQGFTPEGGFLPSAIFLFTLLPLGIAAVLSAKDSAKKIVYGVSTFIVLLGLLVSVYNLLPGRTFSPRFPGYSTSWSIAVDALKESPLFGTGPGNYLTAFNRFRPLAYNQTDLWAIKFATASSYFLTVLTEAGLLGIAGFILLFYTLYKTARKEFREMKLVKWGFTGMANMVSLVMVSLLLLFFPATLLIIAVLFIYLALSTKTHKTSLNLLAQGSQETHTGVISTQQVASRFPALLISVPVILVLLFSGYRGSKILLGEYKFKKALDALVKNDATGTYDTMREAIRLNPRVDRYHSTFSRVNLIIANAIAQRAQTVQGKEGEPATISEQERTTISQLVQQAISEGKAAVALNPLRSGNWEILAQTYRAIMPLAQGADQFTVQTYRQAVALDPINPNLRIALGGVHYALKDYDGAVRIFELAAATKNDFANAHFNFAFALRDAGNLDRAIQEMTLVLSLITDKEGNDYKIAKQALDDLQAKKKAEAPAGEELNPPQAAEEPVIQPPIDLPEGSEPPEAPTTPTPSQSPTPSVKVSITPSPTIVP
ncbi:MAG: hypothetical protein US53_C0028G0003 [Candidatus Woesebacteria bacterium GW2011_GWA1_37_7]|uniref:Uncharacterized protein n=1 Tax=Candidatus Woesebacteria bacterium GW2011_GWA1_37_7 TaxID=1618545 RepID=A0A0G0HET5_9BACT|nr:MAG: hypothetical protein US53_C0028G0003 [Candidatus Woesebacteria bacterium GW2011_GWA1_37_7]